MFGWFKKKTLEEKIQIVKAVAQKEKLSHKYANAVYIAIALEYGWEDVAEHFLTLHMKERINELI